MEERRHLRFRDVVDKVHVELRFKIVKVFHRRNSGDLGISLEYFLLDWVGCSTL